MTKKKIRSKPLIIQKAEKALRAASEKAIKEHKRSGLPLVVWQHGKITRIPANRI